MKNLINHVALVIDDSGSMAHLVNKTRDVVRKQLANFAAASKVSGQETRVSIYTFGTLVNTCAFDVNPSNVGDTDRYIRASSGNTALISAVYEAIKDFKEIPTKKGDHSFLIYAITDGAENASSISSAVLEAEIKGLNDDWTIAAFVPDAMGKHYAKNVGIPADNISIWETTEKGMEEAGGLIAASYTGYSTMRSAGVKSSKTLFEFKDSLTKKEVEKKLEEVDPGTYETLLVRKYDEGKEIKTFVEANRKVPYRVGSAYYQLSKPEKIGGSKTLAVLQISTGKLYSGHQARKFLGLPDHEVKVTPADYDNFDIFVQSTSTNRHLVANTQLIVFK